MLQILMARAVIDERERAIQRQLRERAARRTAQGEAAALTTPASPAHDAAAHAADAPRGAAQPAATTIR